MWLLEPMRGITPHQTRATLTTGILAIGPLPHTQATLANALWTALHPLPHRKRLNGKAPADATLAVGRGHAMPDSRVFAERRDTPIFSSHRASPPFRALLGQLRLYG